MAGHGPSDHGEIILDTGMDGRSRLGRSRQFTLGQMMKAVAGVAIGLAIVRTPELSAFLCLGVGLLVAAGLYGLSRLPPRIRPAVVLTLAVLFLIGYVRSLRFPQYEHRAHRAEVLSGKYWTLAMRAGDPRSSARFLREAERYGRLACVLDREATWYGLARFFTGVRPDAWDGRDFILHFALSEAEEECEATAARMGVRFPGPPLAR